MARDVVGGPYPIIGIHPTLVNVVPTYGVWDDNVGGLIAVTGAGSDSVGDVVCIKPDGNTVRYGQANRIWSGVGWSYDDYCCLRGSNPNGISRVRVPPVIEIDSDTSQTFLNFAKMSNRWLRFDGNKVTADAFSGGATTNECIIVGAGVGPGGRIFPADLSNGRSLWWLATPSTGLLYQYNALTQTEDVSKRSSFGAVPTIIAYSRLYDLFCIVVGNALYFYANEPKANSIAVPTFSSAPYAGRSRTVETRVLGSNNEPCANRLVTFSDGGIGTFPTPTVLTDASGYARTTWRAPWAASAGPHTLTATLTE